MNKLFRRILNYSSMILFYLVLGSLTLFFAGKPLSSYLIAKGKLLINDGEPTALGTLASGVDKILEESEGIVNLSEIQVPEINTRYGTISCERIALSAPLYYGDNNDVFQDGVGQYPNNTLPGMGKPVLISGHDVTYFEPLANVKIGDMITIATDYGTFRYSVVSKKVMDKSDPSAYDLIQGKEQLILYTCYPFGQLIGDRDNRFFVYCDPVITETIE
jgi:sortase A